MRILLLLLCLHLPAVAQADDVADLLARGQYEQAVQVARQEAIANPQDLEAQEQFIDLMMGLGLPAQARTLYEERLKASPGSADAHYLVGRVSTDAAASLAAFEAALRIDPSHARSFMGIGAVRRAEGRTREAAEMYQRALRGDPKLGEAWGGLLATLATSADRQAGLMVAKAALQSVPDHVEAWLLLAAWDPANAGTTLRSAVKAAPQDARIHAALAEQLLGEGKGTEALTEAERALALDPLLKGAQLARLFARSMAAGTLDLAGYKAMLDARTLEGSNADAARLVYDRLCATYARSPLPFMARARNRAAADPAGAAADLEKALTLDARNDEAAAALGLLLVEHGNPARAAELLRDVVSRRPRDPTLAIALARAQLASGDRATARGTATEAARRHPYDLDVALQQIAILAESDDAQGAFQAARDASTRLEDLRLLAALAAAAQASGRLRDAAEAYDKLAKATGKAEFAETARRLRERASAD